MYGISLKGMVSQFIIFFFIMIMMWIGIAYILQNMKYSSACTFHNDVIRNIENHYFSKESIAECKRNAESNGYDLKIELIENDERVDAKVELGYDYTFPIINYTNHYLISGYAK